MPIASTQTLTAGDGHTLSAWQAEPDEPSKDGFPTQAGPRARGGIVIVQEIFGVNAHVRALCTQYALEGYYAVAPALFDRVAPGIELAYDEAGVARGRDLRTRLGWEGPLADVEAAMATASAYGPVAVIGWCWGGSLAWLAATRSRPACAVAYYGGQVAQFRDERPNCPVLMHFGALDPLIPPADVDAIRQAQADVAAARPEGPAVEIEVHAGAGHGFNCTERADYRPEVAAAAFGRTLAFLDRHLRPQPG